MEAWRTRLEAAVAHVNANQLTDAGIALAELIATHSDDPTVAHLQGVVEFGQGQIDAAVTWLSRAATAAPENAQIFNNLGQAYRAQNLLGDAADAFERAGELDPNFAEPLNNLGMLFRQVGKMDEAVGCYRDAIARRGDFPEAHFNLALALEHQGDWRSAAGAYDEAIVLRPDYLAALSNLGNLRMAQGRHADAEQLFRRALEIEPNSPEILNNLGNDLRAQGRLGDAAIELERCLLADPNRQEAHFNLALIKLAVGDYREGWDHYRYRHSIDRSRFAMPQQIWRPDLTGRQILIEGEQGLGDQLFLLRFAPFLIARGARALFRPDAKLAPICRQIGALDEVLEPGSEVPSDDICALGDLPYLLECQETPPPVTLKPDLSRRGELEMLLKAFGPPPYIGITYRAGIDDAGSLFKDAPIADVARCLAGVSGSLINLQRAPGTGEATALENTLGRPALDLTKLNNDLDGMLALLDLLDDYVGVSNTNMHLRASLDLPARVLVTHPAEYRWMAEGEVSPWFPKFKIYRQSASDDWSAAFTALTADLKASNGR